MAMKKTIAEVRVQQEKDLRAQERSWIEAGGSDRHFRYIHEFKSSFMVLLHRGPVGYGVIGNGCRLETDVKWIREEHFIDHHKMTIVPYADAMLQWLCDWMVKRDMPNVMVYANRYIEHWHTEAISVNQCHVCWDLERKRVDFGLHRISEYMQYLFLRGIGRPAVPELDAMVAAMGGGYWPLGFEDGRAIVFKCNEIDLVSPGRKPVRRG